MKFKTLYLCILLSFIGYGIAYSQNCDLPTELPNSLAGIEAANKIIAECYAPIIHQMAEREHDHSVNGRADLITSVHYDKVPDMDGDGEDDIDYDCTNNWENLTDYIGGTTLSHDELDPVVYYSVVWTNVAWVVTYAFYHPRDYAGYVGVCCWDNHENDLEGAILVIDRSTNNVTGGYSISHFNLLTYHTITAIPDVFIDNRGHAVELNIGTDCIEDDGGLSCDNCMHFSLGHIVYTPSQDGNAFVDAEPLVNPDGNMSQNLVGTGEYILEDIFGSSPISLNNLKNSPLIFSGSKFASDGSSDCQDQGEASAPWGWGQLSYSFDSLIDLIFGALNDDGYFPVTPAYFEAIIGTEFEILHNPYFPDCDAEVEYINEHITLTGDIKIKRNVIVNSGVKLTLTDSNWQFATGGSISLRANAELTLDNTTLTSCGSGKWDGIKIDYNNNSVGATIKVLNGSTISNAVTGIDVNSQGVLGGLSINNIQCMDSRFINNNTGVKIKDNENSFTGNVYINCVFEGDQSTGIELINNRASFVHQCTFTNGLIGVSTIDSKVTVREGTAFEGMHQGLLLEGTHPLSSMIKIGDMNTVSNSFTGNDYGIVSSGVIGAGAMQLSNNNFYNDVNTAMTGANFYLINNNSYTGGSYGITSGATGDDMNHIQCNRFTNASADLEIGNLFWLENSNTDFLENEYSSVVGVSTFNTDLRNNIGAPAASASNCFSTSGNTDIAEFGSGSDFFTYHYYDDSATTDCQEPDNPLGYGKSQSLQPGDYCFGDIGVFNLIDPTGSGTPGVIHVIPPDTGDPVICHTCIKDSIDYWIHIVIASGGDDPRTEVNDENPLQAGSPLTTHNEEVLGQWINYALYVAIRTQNWDFAEQVLTPLQKWRWQIRLFGIKMLRGDYIGAQTVLDRLPERNQNEIYFKDIQRINLKRMNGYHGEKRITQAEIAHLRIIAESIHPVSGYARSLYHLLEGELLPVALPNIDISKIRNAKESNNSETEDNSNTRGISIYPNPAIQMFNVVSNTKNIDKVTIYSLEGRKILERDNIDNSHVKIDVANIQAGIYIIHITQENGDSFTDKIIIH